jgi:hypothetical protein
MDTQSLLLTGQSIPENLHLAAGLWFLDSRLIQAKDISRRIVKLVIVELGSEKGGIEG